MHSHLIVWSSRHGDHGRALIVEKHGWGAMRFICRSKKVTHLPFMPAIFGDMLPRLV